MAKTPDESDHTRESVSLGPVLKEELAEINKARLKRMLANHGNYGVGQPRNPAPAPVVPIPGTSSSAPEWQTRDKDYTEWVKVIEDAHGANLVGLAFSGGGIRSAAFSLGVLQALAERKLLSRVDYLSTVSGGGYIGGWLAAWIKRRKSFAKVQNQLAPNRVHQEEDNEPREIRFLRVFSNYLTPKMGLISGDTLAAAAIILRNVLLNQVVLLAVLALLLLLPRAALRWGIPALTSLTNHALIRLVSVLLAVAFVVIMRNMIYLNTRAEGKLLWLARQRHLLWVRNVLRLTKQEQILWLVAGPLFGCAILGALWKELRFGAGESYAPIHCGDAASAGAAAYGAIWLLAIGAGSLFWWLQWSARRQKAKQEWAAIPFWTKTEEILETVAAALTMVGTAVAAGALAGWLYAWLSGYTSGWSPKADLTFGVPLVLGILLLVGTLHIGLMGTAFRDSRREWWGRLGGWLLLWGFAWLTFFWLALYFPGFTSTEFVKKTWGTFAAKYLTPASIVTWIVTTAAGLWAANGDSSGKPGETSWKDLLAKAAPSIFVVGLLCWLSYSIDYIQGSKKFWEYAKTADGGRFIGYLASMIATHRLGAALIGCAVVAVVMAWRLDINQFSMHLLYRNRLVRCFLGASNKRSPNRFTGFDENDDIPLKDLTAEKGYDGPYPVFNASLNLVKGQDLAWQERKAESFVMTPLYCGYDVWLEEQDSPLLHGQGQPKREGRLEPFGYRPTEEYAFPPPGGGLHLGTAMAISGAAANPNMGFYTSAPVAFLLTLFNVRLGQWLGNPRHKNTWRRATPIWGLRYLLCELFAGTTDESRYVHLSDGGHFENMGLYEMVKRRCGLIIVCDAEADGKYEYRGLGNAIRKCRIDMGIDIDLDVKDVTPEKEAEPGKQHCAVGKIHYENADLKAPTGKIIYFKASLNGDEPADVKNYRTMHGSFPHESTIDQWFSESQFEAYRQLGYHEVTTSFPGAPPTAKTPRTNAARDPLHKKLRETFEDFGLATSRRP